MGNFNNEARPLFYVDATGNLVRIGDLIDVEKLDPYQKLQEENRCLKKENEYLKEVNHKYYDYKRTLQCIYDECEVFSDIILYKPSNRDNVKHVTDMLFRAHHSIY